MSLEGGYHHHHHHHFSDEETEAHRVFGALAPEAAELGVEFQGSSA